MCVIVFGAFIGNIGLIDEKKIREKDSSRFGADKSK